MNTIISPNIKKESERIDPAGNIINPKTKQIIKALEPEFIPPIVQPSQEVITTPMENKVGSKIDEMINNLVEKKVAEIVTRKVEEALSKL